MPTGLLCALGTALAYGAGSVLQAAAATRTAPSPRLGPGLLLALVRSWRYVAGLTLDGLGFVLSVVALRSLPLYVVQAVTVAFLAVTALLAVPVLGLRLRRREVVAMLVVLLGLTAVGLSAAPQTGEAPGEALPWLLLAAALLILVLTAVLARDGVRGARGPAALGAAAGTAFGIVAVATRSLAASLAASPSSPASPASSSGSRLLELVRALAGAPATYAVLVAAPLALTAYALALQRGDVVRATAPLVLGETLLPAVAGTLLLGDRPRPGWGVAAWVGFALAVAGALALSRFGEVEQQAPASGGGAD